MDISFLVRCMLDVCYMFEQHITCFKPFVQGHLKGIMLYGYMFLKFYPYTRHRNKKQLTGVLPAPYFYFLVKKLVVFKKKMYLCRSK